MQTSGLPYQAVMVAIEIKPMSRVTTLQYRDALAESNKTSVCVVWSTHGRVDHLLVRCCRTHRMPYLRANTYCVFIHPFFVDIFHSSKRAWGSVMWSFLETSSGHRKTSYRVVEVGQNWGVTVNRCIKWNVKVARWVLRFLLLLTECVQVGDFVSGSDHDCCSINLVE